MKKKILGFLLLVFVFFAGIFNVSALTNEEFSIIKNDVLSMIHRLRELSYFEEGELPKTQEILRYTCVQFYNYESEYFVGWDEPEYKLGPKYKIPAEVFEKFISDSFLVSEEFFAEFREKFKPTGDIIDIKEAAYIVENDKGYYTFTIRDGWGVVSSGFLYNFRGYKDLGNSNYQLYYYLAFEESPDNVVPEDAKEGIDYIMHENYNGQLAKYIIVDEYTSKVYFNGEKTRLLSYLSIEKDEIPSNDELILPNEEKLPEEDNDLFLAGANQKFDANKDEKLTFRIDIGFSLFDKVYINEKEVDKEYYNATEGSTVITFKEEYTKSLKNGKYDLEVTFTDGSVAETTFIVASSVDNASTGLYTSIGLISMVGLIGCASVFIKTRKHRKFPQA